MKYRKLFYPLLLLAVSLAALESNVTAQPFAVPCEDWRVAPFTVVGFAYLDTASLEVELRGGQMYMTKSGGRSQPTVVIRNHTGKPIRWLSLMVVRLGGGGSKGGQIRLESDLADGAEVRVGSDCKSVKPFTKDEFIALGLHDDRLATTVVFGIDELGFSDGTSVKLNQTDRFWDFADRLYVGD